MDKMTSGTTDVSNNDDDDDDDDDGDDDDDDVRSVERGRDVSRPISRLGVLRVCVDDA